MHHTRVVNAQDASDSALILQIARSRHKFGRGVSGEAMVLVNWTPNPRDWEGEQKRFEKDWE